MEGRPRNSWSEWASRVHLEVSAQHRASMHWTVDPVENCIIVGLTDKDLKKGHRKRGQWDCNVTQTETQGCASVITEHRQDGCHKEAQKSKQSIIVGPFSDKTIRCDLHGRHWMESHSRATLQLQLRCSSPMRPYNQSYINSLPQWRITA